MAVTKKSLIGKNSKKTTAKKASPKSNAISSAKLATAMTTTVKLARMVY